ncbi:hypothetical protein [Xanthomarina sp. F2636L]|uniref:hypothetical protein n=1 Tax=Xanthomarina sp. F2636L TaxID=2996018 RepID=UPI00225DF234|nr:hypothetical protein [Xanthomarina sp. F2636L]MCX7552035.1 hypothetical protein [Xanthomarina sp. F2636L]
MKKYLSLFSFIAIFFIGIQSSSAQDAARQQSPEEIAKQKTYELHELVQLTGEQQSAIFHMLVEAEQNMGALNKKDITDSLRKDGTKTVNETVQAYYRKILTPEQYETYQKSLVKDKK